MCAAVCFAVPGQALLDVTVMEGLERKRVQAGERLGDMAVVWFLKPWYHYNVDCSLFRTLWCWQQKLIPCQTLTATQGNLWLLIIRELLWAWKMIVIGDRKWALPSNWPTEKHSESFRAITAVYLGSYIFPLCIHQCMSFKIIWNDNYWWGPEVQHHSALLSFIKHVYRYYKKE